MRSAFAILRYLVPLLLAALLLYFAFKNVDLQDFFAKSSQTNYIWVVASIILSLGAYIVRAHRWNMLFKPMGHDVTIYPTTLAVTIGYLANLAFPRLGEVTRCATLKKTNKIPITVSLGTVISERIVDMITLLALIVLAFLLEYRRISIFFVEIVAEYEINYRGILIALGVMSMVSLLAALILLRSTSMFARRIKKKFLQLFIGLKSIKNVTNFPLFLLDTLILWILYFFMSYLIVFSLPETAGLSISAGFMLLVTGGIALAIPVQGGIGTYHAMVSAMLGLYGIDKTSSLFLATLLHTSQLVAVAIFGGVALLLVFLLSKRKPADNDLG